MRPADLEQRPVDQLVPYAKNSRTHTEAQVAQIAASITRFGFTNPVLVDGEGGIIAGHGRVLAAKSLGLDAVPVLVLDHLTEPERRAYVIADNKLALNAGWDDETLRGEIEALAAQDFDIDLLGFNEDELNDLLADKTAGLTDEDDAPEPPAVPVTVLGDVWLMGAHRLVCGDSTDAETVAAALNGAKPHLMVTDPPYGVEYDASWRNDAVQAGNGARGAPRGRAIGKVMNDDRADWGGRGRFFPEPLRTSGTRAPRAT